MFKRQTETNDHRDINVGGNLQKRRIRFVEPGGRTAYLCNDYSLFLCPTGSTRPYNATTGIRARSYADLDGLAVQRILSGSFDFGFAAEGILLFYGKECAGGGGSAVVYVV